MKHIVRFRYTTATRLHKEIQKWMQTHCGHRGTDWLMSKPRKQHHLPNIVSEVFFHVSLNDEQIALQLRLTFSEHVRA